MTALTGVIAGMPEAEYHAHPALSSSGARRILDSPARFRWEQDRRTESASFDLGHAVHAKVLGVGSDVDVLDFDSFRTKASQEARDAAHAAGRVPILRAKADEVDAIAEAVLAHPTAAALLQREGTSEASVFALCPETGVPLRARFDFLPKADGRILAPVDVKTTGTTVAALDVTRSISKYGYHIQDGHYSDVYTYATGQRPAPLTFLFVEVTPPYFVRAVSLDEDFVQAGREQARKARRIYARCLETDTWPDYGTDIYYASRPTWLVYQEEDED